MNPCLRHGFTACQGLCPLDPLSRRWRASVLVSNHYLVFIKYLILFENKLYIFFSNFWIQKVIYILTIFLPVFLKFLQFYFSPYIPLHHNFSPLYSSLL